MRLIASILLLSLPLLAFSQNFDNGFGFYLPHNDSTTQRFLPHFPKQTANKTVTVGSDGRFWANGQPIRFWGMNMAYAACFPEKNTAPAIAARLRKMGVNLVRFTLMDSPWTDDDGTVFFGETTTQVLNFFNMDRLHFFIAQLKNEGIYINLILQDARTYRTGDGVLHADSMAQTAKAVSMFDRHLIKLQKDFALQLLSPINPYTGLSLANDPAVAMIEITNENTLYGYWKSDWLRHQSQGGDLIQRHVDTLDLRWNTFLQNKYASQMALEASWNQNTGTGNQNEQVTDGGFESGNLPAYYTVELHDVAQATLTADPTNPHSGNTSGRVDVLNATPTNWHIQFKQTGASLTAGKSYRITFAARAQDEREILLVASRDNAPYTYYAGQFFNLTADWQIFSFTFTAPEDNDANFRLGFQFNGQTGSYWFDDLSLTDDEIKGLLPGESLAKGNIRRMDYSERADFSIGRLSDMTAFYLSLQEGYFDEMNAHLKTTLGAKANISGSNTWSGISDVFTARNLDYFNDQNNWDYIKYPNGWSPTDWYIDNEPMVGAGWSTVQPLFGGLAMQGKPYVVSSYSHPFPNRFQVEMMPWMAAYGAFHDAAAINFFYYNDERDSWTTDRVDDYYSLHRNTAIMALSPAYAYAFRQGLIATAGQVRQVDYGLPYLQTLPLLDDSGRWGKFQPYSSRLAFTRSTRSSFGGAQQPNLDGLDHPTGNALTTESGETTIDFDSGMLTTETPQFVSVCGYLQENEVEAGPLSISSANDFGVVSWLSLTGEPLGQATSSLLAISSKLQNTNMGWDGTQTIHQDWGSQPTQIFPLRLDLELSVDADYLRVFPLSPIGKESGHRVVPPMGPGQFLLRLDQSDDRTLWFGIEAVNGPLASGEAPAGRASIFPNPASDYVFVEMEGGSRQLDAVEIMAPDGRVMGQGTNPPGNGKEVWQVAVGHLPAGVYFLKMKNGEAVWMEKLMVGGYQR